MTCRVCGETKPLKNFLMSQKKRKDICYSCEHIRRKNSNPAYAEGKRLQTYKKYWKDPDKERKRTIARESVKRLDPAKYKARRLLCLAVLMKKIDKPSKCQDCKLDLGVAKLHGHHTDYSRPYDVEWLCAKCHGKRHRKDG